MPYMLQDTSKKGKRVPHPPDPTSELYAPLVTAAKAVQRDSFLAFTVADYDYRHMALNWHRFQWEYRVKP